MVGVQDKGESGRMEYQDAGASIQASLLTIVYIWVAVLAKTSPVILRRRTSLHLCYKTWKSGLMLVHTCMYLPCVIVYDVKWGWPIAPGVLSFRAQCESHCVVRAESRRTSLVQVVRPSTAVECAHVLVFLNSLISLQIKSGFINAGLSFVPSKHF